MANLIKLQSPLQSSMRTPLNPLFSDTKTLIENGKMEVNLVQAVIDALSLWDNVMKKQLATPYSDKNDGDENYKEKHNRRINNVERIDKTSFIEKKVLPTNETSSVIQMNNFDPVQGRKYFPFYFCKKCQCLLFQTLFLIQSNQ